MVFWMASGNCDVKNEVKKLLKVWGVSIFVNNDQPIVTFCLG